MNLDNLNSLGQFTGGDEYYTHPSGLKYSEGIKYLAGAAECWWLLDVIASYQPQLLMKATFRYMQFWELKVDLTNHTAVITCREDSGIEPAVTQVIEFTTFPLSEIQLWVEHGMLILPSEH